MDDFVDYKLAKLKIHILAYQEDIADSNTGIQIQNTDGIVLETHGSSTNSTFPEILQCMMQWKLMRFNFVKN